MTAPSFNWLHRACDVAIIGLGRDRNATEELRARDTSQIESILRRHHIMDAFFGALENYHRITSGFLNATILRHDFLFDPCACGGGIWSDVDAARDQRGGRAGDGGCGRCARDGERGGCARDDERVRNAEHIVSTWGRAARTRDRSARGCGRKSWPLPRSTAMSRGAGRRK